MNPVFLDINHEVLLVGLAMPLAVAIILAILSYSKVRAITPPAINDGQFTARVLSALESSNIALTKVADALLIIQRHDEENRTDHKAQIEALTKLVERTSK